MNWTCMWCQSKLLSRKEKILKQCNNCASQAKKVLKDNSIDLKDKAIELWKITSSGKELNLSEKEKDLMKKTLDNKKTRSECIVKWKKEQLSLEQVLDNLEPYGLSRDIVDKIVREW